MGYVNCFVRVTAEGRMHPVSIGGGRGAQDSASVWINTATADGERDLSVAADVVGRVRSADRRRDGDNRKAIFEVELPPPGACEVRILRNGGRIAKLAEIGAKLVALKGIMLEQSEPEHAKRCLDFSRQTLTEIEEQLAEAEGLPEVELPGGVSLRHALACVKLVGECLPPPVETVADAPNEG